MIHTRHPHTTALLGALATTLACAGVHARPSITVHVRLTDDGGAPLNDTVDIRATAFTVPVGGVPLATGEASGVTVANGHLISPLDFDHLLASHWLAFEVRPAGEMDYITLAGRQRVGVAPTAATIHADRHALRVGPDHIAAMEVDHQGVVHMSRLGDPDEGPFLGDVEAPYLQVTEDRAAVGGLDPQATLSIVTSDATGLSVNTLGDNTLGAWIINERVGGDAVHATVGNGTLATGATALATGQDAIALRGRAYAPSGSAAGIRGETASASGAGVRGTSISGTGVLGQHTGGGYGVFSQGALGASGLKTFRIPHPLHADLDLVHYSAESPTPTNLYRGEAILDDTGRAIVHLPEYAQRWNRDWHYLLTPADGPVLVYVATTMHDGAFTIAGDAPGIRVHWEVKARRDDPWVRAWGETRDVIEKSPEQKGRYLQPELFGQPDTLKIGGAQ